MVKEDKQSWKANYFTKLVELLEEYPKCFVVGVDNVGSKQMQQIRISLRGHGVVLMGKNTMIRKCMRGQLENNPKIEKLINHIRGNVGFVFTKGDLIEVRDLILANRVPAAARAGAIAPCDVTIPAQNTGLGPEKTSFFQALHIPTKISRATIEIISDVNLISEGGKVGASEATLLNMLNISPFTYGLVVKYVFDNGSIFEPHVLDITADDIKRAVIQGIQNIAAVSLAIKYPTPASIPHLVNNAFKKLLAVSLATDYTFKQGAEMKELLGDPSKLAAMAAAATAAAPAGDAPKAAAAKVEEKAAESDEDSDGSGFGGLFD